jgi:hypothetical protein
MIGLHYGLPYSQDCDLSPMITPAAKLPLPEWSRELYPVLSTEVKYLTNESQTAHLVTGRYVITQTLIYEKFLTKKAQNIETLGQ